jgi:hypothetical protein
MKTINASIFNFPWPQDRDRPNAASVLADLLKFRFTSIDRSPEGGPCTIEASDGWTDAEDFLLDPSGIARGSYMTFGLRLDRRKVPARTLLKVFRAKLREWEEKERGAAGQQDPLPGVEADPKYMNPNPKPNRAQRKAIKEAARGELLARIVPEPSHAAVVWNASTGTVILESATGALVKAFGKRWEATFGSGPFSLSPGRRLELAGYELPDITTPLGLGFLTWLWKRGEALNYKFQLCGEPGGAHDDVEVTIINSVSLESGQGKDVKKVAVSGDVNNMPEIGEALGQGRLITRAGLLLRNGGGEVWTMKLDGADFAVSGMTLPPVPDDLVDTKEDPHARETFRLRVLEKGLGYLGSLYGVWLEEKRKRGELALAEAPSGPVLATGKTTKGKKKAAALNQAGGQEEAA